MQTSDILKRQAKSVSLKLWWTLLNLYKELNHFLQIISYKMNKKLLEDFKKLSFSEKKKKVLLLLEWLKKSDIVFKKTLKYIKVVNVNEDFLNNTYKGVIEFWTFVFKKQCDKRQDTTRKRIEKIKEQEQKQKDSLNISDFNF